MGMIYSLGLQGKGMATQLIQDIRSPFPSSTLRLSNSLHSANRRRSAIHNGIPVRQRLRDRIPSVVDECPRCGFLGESMPFCYGSLESFGAKGYCRPWRLLSVLAVVDSSDGEALTTTPMAETE
ncbi:hypothetical protein PIB30_044884 [Stylosanthes scabra]|uniref:Uncharacterized protein n=1 Tax=Stylosanthes scabra TaxID=79078 RepID=A0ABU6RGP8_9FABA|nr:hypothetical protein [Stylosanthes scabra]